MQEIGGRIDLKVKEGQTKATRIKGLRSKQTNNKNGGVIMFGLIPFSRKNSGVSRKDDFFGLDRFFNDFFRDPFFSRFSPFASPIRADVKENDREYIVEAEMPGVRKEDITIEISDDVLTLGVDTKNEVNEESEGYIYRERSSGSFKRSFHIQNIKHDEVKASYKDGILTIVLPKDEKAKGAKRISYA